MHLCTMRNTKCGHNYPMTSHMCLGWCPITVKFLYIYMYIALTSRIDTIYLVNDLASNFLYGRRLKSLEILHQEQNPTFLAIFYLPYV